MGIRETINEKPALAYGSFGVLLLIAVVVIFLYLRSGDSSVGRTTRIGDQRFYSDDDGKTWFADAAEKATPFKHDGKDAVRAFVFRCSDGKSFVNYLARHTQVGRLQKGQDLDLERLKSVDTPIAEVKKPNSGAWVPLTPKDKAKFVQIMSLRCPGNADDVPQPVYPD